MMDLLLFISVLLFIYSLIFTLLCLIKPQRFLFLLPPPARTRLKGLICGIYLIIITFFLSGFFIPTGDDFTRIVSSAFCAIFGFLLHRQIKKSTMPPISK